jgi:hypothetical protein
MELVVRLQDGFGTGRAKGWKKKDLQKRVFDLRTENSGVNTKVLLGIHRDEKSFRTY